MSISMLTPITIKSGDCNLNAALFENADKPVIVMLHGGPGSGMAPLLELSAFKRVNEHFTAIYFDQRGCGSSQYDISKGLNYHMLADDVQAVVSWAKQRFPNKPIYLWGGSFGGLLGLIYISQYPNEISRAVISSPAIGLPLMPNSEQFMLSTLRDGASSVDEKYRSMLLEAKSCDDLANNPHMSELLSNMKVLPKGAEGGYSIFAMREWITSLDIRSVLSKLTFPVLMLQGADDDVCPAVVWEDTIKQYANKMVTAKLYQNCGHSLFADCEDDFIEDLTKFLTQN